jgi:hypothetical protein
MMLMNRLALTLSAAASAILLASAAAPGATPIANGAGTAVFPDNTIYMFSFNVVEKSNGTIAGHGQVITNAGQHLHWDITSYMFDENGNLLTAGPITESNIPEIPPGFVAVVGAQDNGGVLNDKYTGAFAIPPDLFGPDIQSIHAAIGSPPADQFIPLDAGNIVIH